jgi:FkbM family methyltransferase
MNTEQATDYFLQHLLGSGQDGQIFVEVGLGSCDWSFQWAVKTGLRCVAVEPLPVPMLRAACQAEGVLLIEAAVGSAAGEAVMHHGELNGFGIPDTSSTRADWWAVGGKTTTVHMLSLQDVIHRAGEGAIACLKVDVEGAEAEVLSGLGDLADGTLPEVVAFEYGGGGSRRSGSGGWDQESFASTEKCLKLLRERGYSWGLVCEKTLELPQSFQLRDLSPGLESLLPDSFEVGNLIVSRSAPPADLQGLLKTFRSRDRWHSLRGKWASRRARASFQVRRYRSAILRRLQGH